MKLWVKYSMISLAFFAVAFPITCVPDLRMNYSRKQVRPLTDRDHVVFLKSWKRFDKENTMRLYDYKITKGVQDINGVPCSGRFTLDSLGRLYGFVLGEDVIFNGTYLPTGSRFESGNVDTLGNRRGYMIFPSDTLRVQGYPVRKTDAFWSHYKVSFYNKGELNAFKALRPVTISGVRCSGEVRHGIRLYPDSSLLTCHLTTDTFIGDRSFSKGDEILMTPRGELKYYTDAEVIAIYREIWKEQKAR